MHKPLILLAIIVAVFAADCGGSKSESPKQKMQATQRAYLAALKHDHVGDACRLTADHAACLQKFAAARALGIKPSDMPSGNEEHLIDTMQVTINGDHARTARGNEFVKRGGKWLMVLPN